MRRLEKPNNNSGDIGSNQSIDVLILTAVQDECDTIREVDSGWEEKSGSRGFPYWIKEVTNESNKKIVVALARATEMGGDPAAAVATRLVTELNPHCMALTGICAGKRSAVALGDVIVADRVFRCDTGKLKRFHDGKTQVSEVFKDIKTYNLDALWTQLAQEFKADLWVPTIVSKRPLSLRYQEEWLIHALSSFEKKGAPHPKLRTDCAANCPEWTTVLDNLVKKQLVTIADDLQLTVKGNFFVRDQNIRFVCPLPIIDPIAPKVYVAPMATGNEVKEDPDLFTAIEKYERKTLAYDMEAAPVAAVAAIARVNFIIVKAVQDFADHDKDDHFRKYAIETAYRFLMAFLKKNFYPHDEHPIPLRDGVVKTADTQILFENKCREYLTKRINSINKDLSQRMFNKDCYVKPYILKIDHGIKEIVYDESKDGLMQEGTRLVIQSDSGFGKTVFLQKYFIKKAEDFKEKPTMVFPFYYHLESLRRYPQLKNIQNSIIDFLTSEIFGSVDGLDESSSQFAVFINNKLVNGEILFLLDGLDQTQIEDDFLRSLFGDGIDPGADAFVDSTVILAGRPNIVQRYEGDFLKNYRHLKIAPFNALQINSYYQKLKDNMKRFDKVKLGRLLQDQDFYELAQTPLIMSLLGQIDFDKVKNKGHVYRNFCKKILADKLRHYARHRPSSDRAALRANAMEQFNKIAYIALTWGYILEHVPVSC